MDVITVSPPLRLRAHVHFHMQRPVFPFIRVKRLVALEFKRQRITVTDEFAHVDLHEIFRHLQAPASASFAMALDKFSVTLASVALAFFVEQRVFLDTQAFAGVALAAACAWLLF